MKNIFYILVLVVVGSGRCLAQTTIWSENFEYYQQSNFASPWMTAGNNGSYPWQCGVDYIVGSTCFPPTGNSTRMAGISDYINIPDSACIYDHNDSNVLLATTSFNLSGYTAVAFKYDSYFRAKQSNGKTESATVEISTNGGNTWTVLKSAPVSSGPHMVTDFIDLSPYAGNASVRLGFRYGDKGEHMVGWMVDNLQGYVPAQNDLALIKGTPDDSLLNYRVVGQSVNVGGVVRNMSASTITGFKIKYILDGQTYADSVTGISLAPFGTLGFQHSSPATVATIGRHPVKIWVEAPGDANNANDSASLVVNGASFYPQKLVTVEEGTGTWNAFAPQGHVYLDRLRLNDNPPAIISLHSQDDMAEDAAYMNYLTHLKGGYFVPFVLFDRRVSIDQDVVVTIPGTSGGVYYIMDSTRFFSQYETIKNYFGFADVSLSQVHTPDDVAINVKVKPAVDLTGAYRLALVLTEDGCKGTTTGYSQANNYAGGGLGTMGGYELLPNPVPASSMVYNAVGRGAFPAVDGKSGSLPASMTHDQSYTTTLTASLKNGWKRGNMHAIVLLLRQSDSSVLNAGQIPLWPLGVASLSGSRQLIANVYPNPASASADILFETTESNASAIITATDAYGRTVWEKQIIYAGGKQVVPIRTDSWSAGMYFIKISTGTSAATMKLMVTGD